MMVNGVTGGLCDYAFVSLNGGVYDDYVQVLMAEVFDVAINDAGLSGDQLASALVNSGLAFQIERQNPKYIVGKSAAELVMLMCEKVGLPCDLPHITYGHGGPDRWLGEMLARFQVVSGCPYRRIFEAYRYDRLRDTYWSHSDWDPDECVAFFRELMLERPAVSRLGEARKAAGLTQAELAQASRVTLRSIQQYEQGAKSINKAAAESVYRLSLVLGCTMEDLLDPPL